jgi:hypothetical protein
MYNNTVTKKTKLYRYLPILILASCSTLPDGQAVKAAAGLAESLQEKDAAALNGDSGTPFLFETEILNAPVQLSALWESLAASGYDFQPAGDILVLEYNGDTWKRFSESREVQIWFERRGPDKPAIVRIPTAGGGLIVIVDRKRSSDARIRGLKVESP